MMKEAGGSRSITHNLLNSPQSCMSANYRYPRRGAGDLRHGTEGTLVCSYSKAF